MRNASEVELIECLDNCIHEGHFVLASKIIEKVEFTFSLFNEYNDKIFQEILRSDL